MIISGTGHRPSKLGNDYDFKTPLMVEVKKLVKEILIHFQATEVISGMALGFDTLLAQCAIELNIPLTAAIPFKGQESRWPTKSKFVYYSILKKANKIYVVDEKRIAPYKEFEAYKLEDRYSPVKMQKRNEWMVNNSDIVIALWDGTPGGTANCYAYAARNVQTIIKRIDPNDIRKKLKKPFWL